MDNFKVMDMPKNERPIEKLLYLGAESLTNSELLAIILRSGVRGENVISLSQRILSKLGGLYGILDVSYEDMISIKGIKNTKASQILALSELVRRIGTLKSKQDRIFINSPKDVAKMLMREMTGINQEILKVIVLNVKNQVIRVRDTFKGSLNTSIVHPREIFCEAIKIGGASIIICHNHPSGDPTPSNEDINITLRIKESGKILGIQLIDHIIIGNNKFISLKEKGII